MLYISSLITKCRIEYYYADDANCISLALWNLQIQPLFYRKVWAMLQVDCSSAFSSPSPRTQPCSSAEVIYQRSLTPPVAESCRLHQLSLFYSLMTLQLKLSYSNSRFRGLLVVQLPLCSLFRLQSHECSLLDHNILHLPYILYIGCCLWFFKSLTRLHSSYM